MTIQIFTTGGTIDKVYFDQSSEFQVGEPQINEVLREANVAFNYCVESILQKDSLDMTENDRQLSWKKYCLLHIGRSSSRMEPIP
jgi:L-asparaginase